MKAVLGVIILAIAASAYPEDASPVAPPNVTSGVTPECPNLSKDEIAQIESAVITEFDPHGANLGDFKEIYGPKQNNNDGSWFCVEKKIEEKDSTRMVHKLTIRNSKSDKKKTLQLFYDKIKPGIYVIRSEDEKAIGRAYIVSSNINHMAVFSCSLEKSAGIFPAIFTSWFAPTPEKVAADEKLLPRMVNIYMSKTTLSLYNGELPEFIKEAVDKTKSKIQNNSKLFGEIVRSNTCPTI